MKAAILSIPQNLAQLPLTVVDVPTREPIPGQVLLSVRACGVCRTDLHILIVYSVKGEAGERSYSITG